MRENVRRIGQRLSGHRLEPRGTLALDDVSFEVKEGESYALVGPNGAGKTTALKMIARISYPTEGTIRVRGRVAALIEVGSGVHPELNAKENIWLYGQILGMSKSQIRQRFDEIVDFAELGHVMSRPVKMYSSGMQLRLGFAIASHLDPDVFLVDEALAVGDAAFQAKCVERMTNLVQEGRTLFYVSHNLPTVESVCQRALLIIGGRAVAEGPTREVIARYLEWVEEQRMGQLEEKATKGFLRVKSATCHGSNGEERHKYQPGEPLEVRIRFSCDEPLERPLVGLDITDGRPGNLITCSMRIDGDAPARVGTEWECICSIDHLPLRPRLYQVYASVHASGGFGRLLKKTPVTSFRVVSPREESVSMASVNAGPIDVPYEWNIREFAAERDASAEDR